MRTDKTPPTERKAAKRNAQSLERGFTTADRSWFILLLLSLSLIGNRDAIAEAKLQVINGKEECPMLHLLPFSNFYDQTVQEAQVSARTGLSYLATAELAIRHFNERNPAVVPELANAEFDNCNVELSTLAAVDSRSDKYATVNEFVHELDRQRDKSLWPCAVVGPESPGGLHFVNTITMSYDIWHVSPHFARPTKKKLESELAFEYASGNATFAEKGTTSSSPPTARPGSLAGRPPKNFQPSLMPDVDQTNKLILQYLLDQSNGDNRFVAVLYENVPELIKQSSHLARAGAELDINIKIVEHPRMIVQLEEVQQTGYRTIIPLLTAPHQVLELAEAADQLGMLDNDDYLFVLPARSTGVRDITHKMGEQVDGSPLDKLLKGALITDYLDGFSIHQEQDRFLQAWQSQNASFVEQLNTMLPPTVQDYFKDEEDKALSDDYFQISLPAEQSSFLYDSIISTGMAACRVSAKATEEPTSKKSRSDKAPPPGGDDTQPPHRFRDLSPTDEKQGTPDPFEKGMLENDFQGASGHVAFPDGEARSSPVYFGVYNARASFNPEMGLNKYSAVLVAYASTHDAEQNGSSSTPFVTVPGESFVYRSGSTVGPMEYRQYNDQNYLSSGVRIFGLSIMGLCWMLALSAAALVVALRNKPVIRYGQPVFLVLLCLGSIVLAASIFTLSWDEGAGWTQEQLDVACMLTPWLFFIGHVVTFSAIFCKLWRLDKVLQVRRRKVGAAQSIGPLFIFLAVTISILVVWTLVDPWHWEREVIQDDLAITYGKCCNKHWWAFFAPLMLCVVISEVIAAYFAIKTNDAPNGLSEGSSVFYTICVQLQAWALGVPILAVIGTSSADTTHVGRVAVIGFFSMSSVVFMVGSKLYRALQTSPRDRDSGDGAIGRLHISGLNSPGVNSPGYEQPSSHVPNGQDQITGASFSHEEEERADLETGISNETDSSVATHPTQGMGLKNINSAQEPFQDENGRAITDIHPYALRRPAAHEAKLTSTEDGECSEESMSTYDEVGPQEALAKISEETTHAIISSGNESPVLNVPNKSGESYQQMVETPPGNEATSKQAILSESVESPIDESFADAESSVAVMAMHKQALTEDAMLDIHGESSVFGTQDSKLFHDSQLQNLSSVAPDDSIAELEQKAVARLNKKKKRRTRLEEMDDTGNELMADRDTDGT